MGAFLAGHWEGQRQISSGLSPYISLSFKSLSLKLDRCLSHTTSGVLDKAPSGIWGPSPRVTEEYMPVATTRILSPLLSFLKMALSLFTILAPLRAFFDRTSGSRGAPAGRWNNFLIIHCMLSYGIVITMTRVILVGGLARCPHKVFFCICGMSWP